MRKIEEKNELLENVLPKNFAREELNKEMLGQVVDLFSNLRVVDHAQEKDVLGRVYEYCLAQFASAEGKNAGEFYTPSCVVRTLVEVLQPYEGRVYDPCCGSGGMFVQSSKFIERRGERRRSFGLRTGGERDDAEACEDEPSDSRNRSGFGRG